jgi:DNA invertase Pin-like site-specific DNA recombinase
MKAALYLRVSTDEQTVLNQRRELEAVAERHGWEIVAVFTDEGISGAKGREQRPAFHRLLQGVARKEFDLVAAWSVDRLGRSLQHLLGFLAELQAKDVDLYLHQQRIDTGTPAGKALFGMLGVFAEFERAILRERIQSGMRRTRADGRRFGRPLKRLDLPKARAMMTGGKSLPQVAAAMGIPSSTLSGRLRAELKPPTATTAS